MELLKKEEPKDISEKDIKKQLEFQKRVSIEEGKYMSFLQKLVSEYLDKLTGAKETDEKLFDFLNKKWRMKSDEINSFNKYIKPNHLLFDLFVLRSSKEGLKVIDHMYDVDRRLGEINDCYFNMQEDKEIFYKKVGEILTVNIDQEKQEVS